MLCPVCGYVMDPFEKDCPRCAREEQSLFEEVIQVEENDGHEEASYDLSKFATEEQPFILPPAPETDAPATISPVFPLNELQIEDDDTMDPIEKTCEQVIQPYETEDKEERILDLTEFDETRPLPPLQAPENNSRTTPKNPQHILTPQDLEAAPTQLQNAYEQVIQTDELPIQDGILDLTNLEENQPKQ